MIISCIRTKNERTLPALTSTPPAKKDGTILGYDDEFVPNAMKDKSLMMAAMDPAKLRRQKMN
jgi:hypothetical protein